MPLFKKPAITPEEKAAALKQAVRLWLADKYSHAVDLYKRYGISDAEFTQAMLIASRNQPNSVTTPEKAAALKTALKLWNAGSYQKSTELCKKYGISTKDFTRVLVETMHKTK